MANSRTMYMAKKAIATGGAGTHNDITVAWDSVTFTPSASLGVATWQLRFITNDDAAISLAVHTVDEDGDEVELELSPFVTADVDSDGELEITVDSTNPSIKVACAGGSATATVKCKAFRSVDDISRGAYDAGSASDFGGMS